MRNVRLGFIALLCWSSVGLASSSLSLSLQDAERAALANAPELQRFEAKRQALAAKAVADGELPDPKLMAGTINVPTNTFSFTQDDMTMIEVGLSQSFPKGHSRAIKSAQTTAQSTAEQRKEEEEALTLLQQVRQSWLDVYDKTASLRIVDENQKILTYLLKTTRAQYSVGKDTLSNVLQVQLMLSQLDDTKTQTQEQLDVARAALGRWIGQAAANLPITPALPHWPSPPSLIDMQSQLQKHPLLKVDAADVDVARDEVALAKEQYKPGFEVGVSYGLRQGNMMGDNGMPTPRANMVTAEVTMDLPVFTKNRQDKQLQASNDDLEASELSQQIDYRNLVKVLNEQYATWHRLSERNTLYTQELVPVAKQNAKAALLAYQSATTDMTTVLRAYSALKDVELEQLNVAVEREKVRASLLYLEGLSQ